MEIEKLKIINGEVETDVSYQEITKDTSPFKEILDFLLIILIFS